jgi:uncharacterized Fe-S cluster protein YjdI
LVAQTKHCSHSAACIRVAAYVPQRLHLCRCISVDLSRDRSICHYSECLRVSGEFWTLAQAAKPLEFCKCAPEDVNLASVQAIRFDDFHMRSGYCPPAGARESLPMRAPPGSPRRFQTKLNASVGEGYISSHKITSDNWCWTKCLNTRGCVAAVRFRALCYLKADLSEHLITCLLGAHLLYPVSSRELRMPLAGWNDPGAISACAQLCSMACLL